MNQQEIECIKKQADAKFVTIINKYVKLKKSGKHHKGKCPFCGKPDFYATSIGIYRCFSCNKGGNIFNFIMDTMKLSFVKAVNHIKNML